MVYYFMERLKSLAFLSLSDKISFKNTWRNHDTLIVQIGS